MTICARRLLTSTSAAFSAAALSTATLHSGTLLAATCCTATLLATTRLGAATLICALRGCWMHTGSTTISFGASLVTIAAHGGAVPFGTDCISAIAVFGWVLNAAVAAN
jgi:hypothetical protein